MNKHNRILAIALSLMLASSLILTGCGSLSTMLAEPEPPRSETTPVELTNILRTEEVYEGIEVLHGSWEEPCYSPDNKGYFYEYRGWIYLHVEGEPAERGYQQGWLLADYIQHNIDSSITMLAELQAIDWDYFRINAERMWSEKVNEEILAELEGIVAGAAERGATFDYLDLLVLNGLEELRDCWFPTVQDVYYQELAAGIWSPKAVVTGTTTVQGEQPKTEQSDADADTDAEADAEAGTETEESTDQAEEEPASEDSPADTQDTANASEEEGSTDTEADEEEEGTDSDSKIEEGQSEEESNIALIPYVETEGLTGVSDSEAIKKLVQPGGAFVKQASAILATGSATEDGAIILAQNTIASYCDSNFNNVMVDVAPSEGIRFTMQAAPGFIHSVGEAYSTESLVVANTRIAGFNVYSEDGMPEFLRIRSAVQYATTLDSFTTLMTAQTNGGLASSWLVGDLATNQIMELELGLSFYNVQKITDGCFISFDGVDDTRILNFETDGSSYTDIRTGSGSRYVRLSELCKIYYGKFNVENAQTLLSDHNDAYLSKNSAGSRSVCAHYNLDDAEHAAQSDCIPYMPYGTVDAKVMSSELAAEHTIVARWGSACGKTFDSLNFIDKHPQYHALQDFLYDKPMQFWSELYPLA